MGAVACAAIVYAGCSSSTPIARVTDVLQVRPVLVDDPLASVLLDEEGGEVRVGDAVISDARIWMALMAKAPRDHDLLIRLRETDGIRWRNFARRNRGRNAALILDGRVIKIFPIVPIDDEVEITTVVVPDAVGSDASTERIVKRIDAITPAQSEAPAPKR